MNCNHNCNNSFILSPTTTNQQQKETTTTMANNTQRALLTWQHGESTKTCVFVDIKEDMTMDDIVMEGRRQVYEALQVEGKFCNCRGNFTNFLSYPHEQPNINNKLHREGKRYIDVINSTLPEFCWLNNAVVLFDALDG